MTGTLLTLAVPLLLSAGLSAAPAVPAVPAPSAPAAARTEAGFRAVRSFEAVPAFGITEASVFEIDPSLFRVRTVSARKAAGKAKVSVQALRKLLPSAALMINAGFFNPPDGLLIGDFVEGGARPDGIIYAPGENLDRLFVVGKDGSASVVNGTEKLGDEQLAAAVSAVAGKSDWPGHANSTNRSAVCVTPAGKVLIAAVYPVRTLQKLFAYMESEGCAPGSVVNLDGGGSTQMSCNFGGSAWSFGWERKGTNVPECHVGGGIDDARCYRAVATFLVVEPREGK